MRKVRLVIAVGIVVLILLFVGLFIAAKANAITTVKRVIDGDTLIVETDGQEETIRLLNIDTPETKDPAQPVQCLGTEAADWLTNRLPVGTIIELEFDAEKHDKYGRTLAGVYKDDSLINAEIAAEGLGVPKTYGANNKFRAEIDEASSEAQESKRGLFDPAIDCTLPAHLKALETLYDDALPAIPTDGDPAAALEQAQSLAEETAPLVEQFSSTGLPGAGLGIYATQSVTGMLETAQRDVDTIKRQIQDRVGALQTAQENWDKEQERIEKERLEKERLEKERLEAEERKKAEAAAQERARMQPPAAPRSVPVQPKPAPVTQPPAKQPAPAPPVAPPKTNPQPAPAPAPAPKPKTGSSCVPYGPQISYANDGGYTGKRYGMPGGKAFRKCN